MDIQQSAKDVGQPQTAVGQAGVFRDLLPIAMWRIDSEGRITQWSLAAQELFGHTAEEVLGRSATPLLVPVANWELADELTRRVLSGEAVVGTLPVRHRDGHLVTMEMWICPSADPQGRTGLLGIAAETSAVLRMRDSLAALEGLFTQSPIGLAMLGPDLRYVRVNDALARMNGVPAAQHIGRRVSEVVPGLNTMALETVMRQVLARGEPVVDFRGLGYTGTDPRERVWSCSFSPLLGGGGRRLGVIATLIDITREERAQAQAARGRQRLALLAEAGTRIGTTLDLRQTAEEVVQVLVPRVADSADLHLLEEVIDPDEATASARGMVRRLAVSFADPAAPVQDLAVGMTHHIPRASAYEQVMVDGRPLKLTRADIPRLVPGPGNERLRDYLHTLGSARMVPLVARGTVLGIVMVTRSRRREPFDDQDNLLIDELAARAALGIDNARMYSAQRRAALTLQRSLTNTALPTVPGLELAGRYLPASDQEVGGDWFDVIALPGDRTALVIGDVMGHGVHAAAVMGQLRTSVRTLARHDIPPSELLRSLDAAVADVGENEMATCVYAVHDPSDGSCLVGRAGHPPPAVVAAGGIVAFLDGPTGTPLGVGGQDFRTERVRLPPGSLLVLYTDGLIEARDRNLDQGMLELARALRDPDPPLSRICDHVLGRLLPRGAQDDVAMLLARPLPSTGARPVHHDLPR